MLKKLLLVMILITSGIIISTDSYAHKPHQDTFLKYLEESMPHKNGMSKEGFNTIKDNIVAFNYEAHFTNSDDKLEQELYKIMSDKNFSQNKYIKVMENIFGEKYKYQDTSTAIINKLSQNDRIVLFKAMEHLNLSKDKIKQT